MLSEESRGCKRFLGHDITARCHDKIGLLAFVIGSPRPDAEAFRAVRDGVLHAEILQVQLLVGDDGVDVVGGAETVVHNRQQAISVRREIDADNLWGLVGNDIQEPRILMGEAIVIWFVQLVISSPWIRPDTAHLAARLWTLGGY